MTDNCNQRILVIGCPGSGKSTFSKILGNILDIEVIHLDKYFWKPGWTQSSLDEWYETVSSLVLKDKWIIDGNYSNTLRLRTRHADEILFFDFPSVFCIYRIFKRIFKSKLKLETRDDMADGCYEKWFDREFVKFTWNFNRDIRPLNYRVLEEINFDKKDLSIFKNSKEAADYLNKLKLKYEYHN